MSFKDALAFETAIDKELLPSSYQVIGDVVLIKFFKIKSHPQKNTIAKVVLKMMPHIKTVLEITGVGGEFRIPKVRKLAGGDSVTVHKEHGILYKLDASKIMFSKGNIFERKRIAEKVKWNEIVVDVFAGIGYFSLGIGKARSSAKIYAIEKNPVAFRYLKENIELNRLKNIEAVLGDCRKVSIIDADRVIMGYFPGTEKFLPYAMGMVKDGGVIHYHNIYRRWELWRKPIAELKKHVSNFRVLEKKKVKSAGPNLYHIVMDVKVKK
jgi:tRNA wybutosine-synthesizing protein 2